MLPSQRALFDIPRDVCFLNAAAWSPLPIAVQEAGRAAVGRKGQPWKLDGAFFQAQYERARKAAAGTRGGVHLSATLAKLARKERYLAAELTGRRYDIGAHYGLLTAQLALALSGKDRDEVLTGLVELLAQRVK